MKNINEIVGSGLCTGCAACYSVCPRGYKKYKPDGGMGFPVPGAENCEDCGACLKACPSADTYEDDD